MSLYISRLRQRRFFSIFLTVLLFAAVVASVNVQLIAHFSTHVNSHPTSDVFEMPYFLRWTEHVIFDLGVSPLFAPGIFFPHSWRVAAGLYPVWWAVALTPFTH